MSRSRILTLLGLLFFCLLSLYYLRPSAPDPGFTAHWMRSDQQMLQADGGGSKMRFIKSHSAGQYDVTSWKHVSQEYEGATRKQYEIDELEGKHLLSQNPYEAALKAQQRQGGGKGSGGAPGNVDAEMDAIKEISERAKQKLLEMRPMLDLWGSFGGKRRERRARK